MLDHGTIPTVIDRYGRQRSAFVPSTIRRYMEMNCPASCGLCTADDFGPARPVPNLALPIAQQPVRIHARMHAHMHAKICMHTRIYARICTHAHMHALLAYIQMNGRTTSCRSLGPLSTIHSASLSQARPRRLPRCMILHVLTAVWVRVCVGQNVAG